MTVIYQTTITRIGQSAPDALCDQMLITFREGAPADIEEFCFIHSHGELNGSLQAGISLNWASTTTRSPPLAALRNKTYVNSGI